MKKPLALLLLTLLYSSVYAQSEDYDLFTLFESEPGFRLGDILDEATAGLPHRADLNLDGVADLTLLRHDQQGNPVEIYTLDLTTEEPTILWQYPYEDIVTALGTSSFRFMGFFSFTDGTADREVIFKAPDGVALVSTTVTGGKHTANDPLVLPAERIAVLDLTGDGVMELVIQNRESGTVQVWGGSTTNTATEAEIEAALLRLSQNYPNPFYETTTIAYQVEQSGPVTITVFDLLGRHVRTLVATDQPTGSYHIQWDGRDAGGQPVASGTYFYRMRVGEAVSSKQAIRLK